MARLSSLTDARLDSLYSSDGFGGEKTMRARVIRELIDEIRSLRAELAGHVVNGGQRHAASDPPLS